MVSGWSAVNEKKLLTAGYGVTGLDLCERQGLELRTSMLPA
jgi:hypothetical protein